MTTVEDLLNVPDAAISGEAADLLSEPGPVEKKDFSGIGSGPTMSGSLRRPCGHWNERSRGRTVIGDSRAGRKSRLAATAWAASTGIVSLMDALNIIEVWEARSYWKCRAMALGMLVVLCLFFLGAFILLASGGEVTS